MKRLKHSEVLTLLKAVPEGDFTSLKLNPSMVYAATALFKMHPERFIIAKRLANTGSRSAREKITAKFSGLLWVIVENYRYPHNSVQTIEEACRTQIARRQEYAKGELLLEWSLQNVLHETEESLRDSLVDDKAFTFGATVQEAFKSKEEDWFWRGLAAVILISDGKEIRRIDVHENREFIALAGKHSDIGAVINAARKLGTLRAIEIETLMDTELPVPTALLTGTL